MSRPRTTKEEQRWQHVRRVVLQRDELRCRDCGESADRRELDVHHLIRRSDGGRDEASNCITLCDGCHAARHPNLQASLSRRAIERWALRLARLLDRGRLLDDETRTLDAGLRLFGVDRFRDGQLDAVLAALRGESVLVIRPTGGGKSLCFQLPAVLKGQPTTFVLSPLKALMVDQVAGLQRRKLPATFINSDIAREEKEQRYELLEAGALSLLYVAPERFNPERVRPEEIERLARQRPSFLVIDEAHLVDRWGDDFRIAPVRPPPQSPGTEPELGDGAPAPPGTAAGVVPAAGPAPSDRRGRRDGCVLGHQDPHRHVGDRGKHQDARDPQQASDERVDVVATGKAPEHSRQDPALTGTREALLCEPCSRAGKRIVVEIDRRVCGNGHVRLLCFSRADRGVVCV